jgi:hypothetical protein
VCAPDIRCVALLLLLLLQEPNGARIVATGGSPVAYSSPALSGEQQQQLAADVQVCCMALTPAHGANLGKVAENLTTSLL